MKKFGLMLQNGPLRSVETKVGYSSNALFLLVTENLSFENRIQLGWPCTFATCFCASSCPSNRYRICFSLSEFVLTSSQVPADAVMLLLEPFKFVLGHTDKFAFIYHCSGVSLCDHIPQCTCSGSRMPGDLWGADEGPALGHRS